MLVFITADRILFYLPSASGDALIMLAFPPVYRLVNCLLGFRSTSMLLMLELITYLLAFHAALFSVTKARAMLTEKFLAATGLLSMILLLFRVS